MGLDITVYTDIIVLETHDCKEPHGDDCYDLGHIATYAYTPFTQSFRGLPVLSEDDQFIHGPWVTSGPSWGFRAGSYGGYNQWRSTLMKRVWNIEKMDYTDVDQYRELPFFELIWFADNEGTIGPESCDDLLQDFEAHAETLRFGSDEYWWESYKEWHAAFRDTAGSGVVDFH